MKIHTWIQWSSPSTQQWLKQPGLSLVHLRGLGRTQQRTECHLGLLFLIPSQRYLWPLFLCFCLCLFGDALFLCSALCYSALDIPVGSTPFLDFFPDFFFCAAHILIRCSPLDEQECDLCLCLSLLKLLHFFLERGCAFLVSSSSDESEPKLLSCLCFFLVAECDQALLRVHQTGMTTLHQAIVNYCENPLWSHTLHLRILLLTPFHHFLARLFLLQLPRGTVRLCWR